MARGEKLDDLVDQSDQLVNSVSYYFKFVKLTCNQSAVFAKNSKKSKTTFGFGKKARKAKRNSTVKEKEKECYEIAEEEEACEDVDALEVRDGLSSRLDSDDDNSSSEGSDANSVRSLRSSSASEAGCDDEEAFDDNLEVDGDTWGSAKSEPEIAQGDEHVMISYNWNSQTTVVKLAQMLRSRGYSIWIDVEQMSGSTLEAMANAVERASVVLVCVTRAYKDSANCR